MQPENCHFAQSWRAANRPTSIRRQPCQLQGLHVPLANLLPQHHAKHPNSAIVVRSVPQTNITSHATVFVATEAPVKQEAVDTRRTDEPKPSGHRKRKQQQLALENADSRISQLESLRLLEWPELCQQVGYLLHWLVMLPLIAAVQDTFLGQQMREQATCPAALPRFCLDAAPSCTDILQHEHADTTTGRDYIFVHPCVPSS